MKEVLFLSLIHISTPTLSIEETYDKFIISGNEEKKEVALVFPIIIQQIQNK